MKLVFDSTTLASPEQLVGKSSYSRRTLLSAILELFANNGLVFVGVSEEKAPYVIAFGIFRVEQHLGYGLKVEAAPSACGTGIIFEVCAIANYGRGWHELRELRVALPVDKRVFCSAKARWSTSEKLRQFDIEQDYPGWHLEALKHTVYLELEKRQMEDEGQKQLRWLSEKLDTSEQGEFHGQSYTGKVITSKNGPQVQLAIQSEDVQKIVRIVGILNESRVT